MTGVSSGRGNVSLVNVTMRRPILVVLLLLLATGGSLPAFPSDTVLRIWAMGAEGEKMGAMARAFELAHPGVKVSCQAIPWGEAHAKLITAFVGGHTPDVAQLGTTWTPEFRAMDALLPLDRFMRRDGFDGKVFFPGAWKTVAFEDGCYGVPWYVETRCLYYRKDILAAAGIAAPPRTWEELESAGRTLAAKTGRFAILLPERDEQAFFPFIGQAGARILDEQGRPAVTSAPFERALSFYVGLFDQRIAPRGQMKDVDVVQSFAEEKPPFAMFVSGPWMLSQVDEKAPQLKGRWGAAPLPVGVKASSYMGGCNLVAFKGSKHPELAWEFIRFVSQRETQVAWFKATGDLPSRQDAWTDPSLASDERLAAFKTQLESAEPPPTVPEWEQMADAIARRMEQAVLGQSTVPVSLAALNTDIAYVLRSRAEGQSLLYKVGILGSAGLALVMGFVWYFRGALREKAPRGQGIAVTLFLAPALSILTIFLFLPVIASFLMSLTNYDLYSIADWRKMHVVGLANYAMVLRDPLFWKSVTNTMIFAAVGGPLTIGLSLAAAMALERMMRVRAVYLLGFFLPVVTTLVAVAIVWKWIYHPRFGLLNVALSFLGSSPRDWLSNPNTAMWCLVAMAVWKNFGYTMVILLAGLQSIPRSYYEAASIDGAGPLSKFKEITVPLLAPTLFLVTLMTTIGYLQFFAEPYVMTQGGPVDSTLSVVLYLYRKGFKFYLLGEAAATSFVLFLLIFAISLVQILTRRRQEAS